MEEELENGISLMEGILQNWANENKGKYHIFFPRCAKENDKDVVLFPIFEENKNGTLNLKVWAKYSLENYSLEDYLEAKNKVILFDKKLINYKKKKFAQNVIALIEIFYTAQEFMELSEDSIEYIANQELLEEKIDEYKQKFKTILAEEELAIAYGVKKNEPVKTEKAKLPVTNIQPIESKKKEKEEKKTVKIPDLTIKKLQESISKIDHKNNSKEKYMLKLMEEVGELAKVVNEDVRMKDKEIKGTIEEELQDVLYYVTCLANIYGIDLEECIYLKLEVSTRMIRIYKQELEQAGIYIQGKQGVNGGYILDNMKNTIDIGLTGEEIYQLKNMKKNELDEAIIDKIIKSYMTNEHRKDNTKSEQLMPEFTEIYKDFRLAINSRNKIFIEFKSINSGITKRTIHPAELFTYLNNWYVAAFCELRNEIRLFKLNDIISYKILDEKYEKEVNFKRW